MIDIRKYLEDNHIEPPNGMSQELFLKAILNFIPYAYEATNDEVKAIKLTIKIIKGHDTRIKHND